MRTEGRPSNGKKSARPTSATPRPQGAAGQRSAESGARGASSGGTRGTNAGGGGGANASGGRGATAKGAPTSRKGASGSSGTPSATSSGKRPSGASGRGTGGPGSSRSGPPSGAAVYRRRRLVVLVLLVALIVGIGFGVNWFLNWRTSDGASSAPTTTSVATPSADPSAGDGTDTAASVEPEPTGSPDEDALSNPVACRPAALGLEISLPADTFPAGSAVTIPTTVTNAGQVQCLLDAGSAHLVLTIFSGDDRVWSSDDCPAVAAERPILLDIATSDSIRISWPGTRSAPGCPDVQPAAAAGTYRAVLTVDTGSTQATAEKVFTLS